MDLGGSFLTPRVGVSKLMRDPSLYRGPDGTYHLVWTTGWSEKGFGYASSKDLLRWSEQKYVEVMAHEPTTLNVWAPEIHYDDARREFLIYWSSTIPGRFPGDDEHPEKRNHRIYYCTTRDFHTFSKPQVLFDPGYSVIDAVIVRLPRGGYALVFKDERGPMRRLRVAFSPGLRGPYANISRPFTEMFTEGPSVLRRGDEWLVYYDRHRAGDYGAVKTRDFKTWEDVSREVTFPKGHKHGTVLEVTPDLVDGLLRSRPRLRTPSPDSTP
jgi:beta-xylosidase